MYDSAKRSLAFTVATGGLLLTGTAFSTAFAAAGVGADHGPARAHGVQSDAKSASSVTAAGYFGGVQAPPDLLASSKHHPGGITSDKKVRFPDHLHPCGDHVKDDAVRGENSDSQCTKSAEGSAPTTPEGPAAGSGGASATAAYVSSDECDDDEYLVKGANGEDYCAPAPSTSATCPCSPPTTPSTPPTCTCSPTSTTSSPPTTPPTTTSTSPTTVSSPPHKTPPPHHLAHTGADVGIALGVSGAALLAGIGMRAAARRREEGE